MDTRAGHRLSTLEAEIARHTAEVQILREHLEDRLSTAMDLWVRALAAETPYADREFDRADRECRRIQKQLDSEERRLESLVRERARFPGSVEGPQVAPERPAQRAVGNPGDGRDAYNAYRGRGGGPLHRRPPDARG